ncbi:VOC family protein [Kutzneria sp. NPDC051319]|uniref:VOC family protein n=1 Tax=Kutzneria sp. NPDC051319 TaxID=3155047 RepID=UPI003418A7DD
MALHMLASIVVGVPNVEETGAYYTEFGLTPTGGGWYATADGGNQLRLVETPFRRLVACTVGVDDPDDLNRVEARLRRLEMVTRRGADRLTAIDPVGGVEVNLEVRPRLVQPAVEPTRYNWPGRIDRPGTRAEVLRRPDRVRPRKLGHIVLGTTDFDASKRFFVDGIGFKVSDVLRTSAFTRCSTDHHNLLLVRAPVDFLQHTSWQVDDVD